MFQDTPPQLSPLVTVVTELIRNLPGILTAAGVIVTAYLGYRANKLTKVNTLISRDNSRKLGEVHDAITNTGDPQENEYR